VCHLGGRGRCKVNGVDTGGACELELELVMLKWPLDRLNPPFPRLASICLRKASNSGLASKGSCFGIAATNDLTEDVGELQFSWGNSAVSRGSAVVVSMAMPK